MAYRALLSLPAVLGSTSLCTAWLQRAAGPATCWAADSARRSVASFRLEHETVAPPGEGLPPPWEPPAHNPKSLKPQPAPTLPEILARIQQAPNAIEVHNAYRRKSGCLPPPIAAAMFARLSRLMAAAALMAAAPQPQPQSKDAPSAGAASSQARERGQGALVAEIRRSWDVFLHLTPARQLAALVRASCETGLLLQPARSAAASAASTSGGERSLVARSLDVLLDNNGRELSEAGPQAVLDVSYGLMLAGHNKASTWRKLAPLLRAAEAALRGDGGLAVGKDGGAAGLTPAELAAQVLRWLKGRKGVPV